MPLKPSAGARGKAAQRAVPSSVSNEAKVFIVKWSQILIFLATSPVSGQTFFMRLKQEILKILAMPKVESLAGDRPLRDGKTYERASNARVNFFLARVKTVPNFTLFCRKKTFI